MLVRVARSLIAGGISDTFTPMQVIKWNKSFAVVTVTKARGWKGVCQIYMEGLWV
jgi:hypothetical protein